MVRDYKLKEDHTENTIRRQFAEVYLQQIITEVTGRLTERDSARCFKSTIQRYLAQFGPNEIVPP